MQMEKSWRKDVRDTQNVNNVKKSDTDSSKIPDGQGTWNWSTLCKKV